MTHTPGPWIVRDETDIWGHDSRFPDAPVAIKTRVTRLLFVGEHVEHQSGLSWDWPETWANARLIAAAPVLLEAAKAAHEVLMTEGACSPGGHSCRDCVLERQLRAAIALAEDGPQ